MKPLKYVPVPISFVHSGAARNDAAIIVYTTEYRLLVVLHRMSKNCTDKLQGVNLWCSTRKTVCCILCCELQPTENQNVQNIQLELQWRMPIWMVIVLFTGKSLSYKSFDIHYVSFLDVIDFCCISNNLQVSLGIQSRSCYWATKCSPIWKQIQEFIKY